MPQISVRVPLTALQQVNALAGTQYELLPARLYPRGALAEFAIKVDATGVLETVQTGADVVEEESPCSVGTINLKPVYPDDFTLNDLVAPMEKINVKLRDTSGAGRVAMVTVRFTAL